MRFQLLFDINAQYFIFIQILPKINQKLLEMKNEVASDHGVNIIWNYAKQDYSWRKSYYKYFSKRENSFSFCPYYFYSCQSMERMTCFTIILGHYLYHWA